MKFAHTFARIPRHHFTHRAKYQAATPPSPPLTPLPWVCHLGVAHVIRGVSGALLNDGAT